MPHTVETRRVDIEYPAERMGRHFVGGDIAMSHVVAALSAMFPDGEDFFVRSVRAFRHEITDPVLKDQVRGFIGQEAMHGRQHRQFNDVLSALGYPTKGIERMVDTGLRFRERIQSRRANLALTAALEHYTATLAETLLSSEEARRQVGQIPEVGMLLLWHALEESEHKAVAFDVYRHVGGREWMRRLLMNVTTVFFLAALVGSVVVSLARDPVARRHPVRTVRSLAALRRSPFLARDVLGRIRSYNRPGFHPDDIDASALVERWRAELFGADGPLAGALTPR